MKKYLKVLVIISISLSTALSQQSSHAESKDRSLFKNRNSLTEFFEDGEVYLSFRYRFENVDQDGISNDANASTLRSILGFKTTEVYSLNGHVEVEDVSEIGPDNFNNTTNGRSDRPVVADVDGTEVNILTLASSHIPDSSILVGRYHKILDNARFIGDVGWRQNNQTFDGATFTNTSVKDLEFFYGYMWNVNRIFGDDSPVGDIDSENHLFHINYSGIKNNSISLYSYLLDLEDLPGLSSATYGVLTTGMYEIVDDFTLNYDLEYGYQTDYADNSTSYDANYYRIGMGLGFGDFALSGGVETLGSDNGDIAFSTPLATLHKWNGWADMFLSTPAQGLQDSYGKLSYTHNQWNETFGATSLALVYHHFESDEGSVKYGTEWDVNLVQNFLQKYFFGVKFARYNADNFAVDTTKVIFSLGASFSTAS